MEKSKKQLNVGVLGCGPIAQAAHFDACSKAKNIKLYAICDIAEDLLVQMEQKWHPERIYTDYDEMISDPALDAVIIATADVIHIPLAKKAINAGKHVFVEKPIGTKIEEAKELESLLLEKKLILQVGNMKRFDPGIVYAKQFIDEFGGKGISCNGWYCDSIRRYEMTDSLQPIIISSKSKKIYPGGDPKADKQKYYLMTHGVHLFNTLQFINGPIEWVEAHYSDQLGIYTWAVTAGIKKSTSLLQAQLIVSVRDDWQEGFNWYGDRGSVHCKTYLPWYYKSSEVRCFSSETNKYTSVIGADAHFYKLELEAFADAINNNEPSPVSIKDGIQDLRTLIAISMSVKQNGQRVYVDATTGEVL